MVFQCPQFDPVPIIIDFFVFFKKNVIFTAGSTFCALASGQLMQKMMMKCNTVKSRLEPTQHSCLRSISAVILRFGTHKTRPLTHSRNPPRGTLKPSQVLPSIDPVQLCFMESFRGWIIYIWVMNTVLSTTEDAHRQKKKQCPCGAVGVGTPGALSFSLVEWAHVSLLFTSTGGAKAWFLPPELSCWPVGPDGSAWTHGRRGGSNIAFDLTIDLWRSL